MAGRVHGNCRRTAGQKLPSSPVKHQHYNVNLQVSVKRANQTKPAKINFNSFLEHSSKLDSLTSMNTTTQQSEKTKWTRADIVFEGILAKNQIARNSGRATREQLIDIEDALQLAMRLLNRTDNQPSVISCWDQHVI